MVPSTLEAAIVFALVIAPGFLMVRGYSRRTTRSQPERDLYALAQAVIASVVWLVVVYFVLQTQLRDWGVLPRSDTKLAKHESAVALGLLGVVLLPYAVGWLAAAVSTRLGGWMGAWMDQRSSGLPVDPDGGRLRRTRGAVRRLPKHLANALANEVERSGVVTPPTAWDAAWLGARKRGPGKATIRLNSGLRIEGTYGRGAQIDLSPLPRQLYLPEGYGYDEEGAPEPRANGGRGVFIDGSEIGAIYFEDA